MTPDYLLCDRCGAQTSAKCRLFVETGYGFNGVENVADGRSVDLCGPCATAGLKYVLEQSEHGFDRDGLGRRLLDWVGQKVKP